MSQILGQHLFSIDSILKQISLCGSQVIISNPWIMRLRIYPCTPSMRAEIHSQQLFHVTQPLSHKVIRHTLVFLVCIPIITGGRKKRRMNAGKTIKISQCLVVVAIYSCLNGPNHSYLFLHIRDSPLKIKNKTV